MKHRRKENEILFFFFLEMTNEENTPLLMAVDVDKDVT